MLVRDHDAHFRLFGHLCLRAISDATSSPSAALETAGIRGTEGAARVGLSPEEVPPFPVASQPGDVIVFGQRTRQASFGGHTGKRIFR